jgi:hypothetical protein
MPGSLFDNDVLLENLIGQSSIRHNPPFRPSIKRRACGPKVDHDVSKVLKELLTVGRADTFRMPLSAEYRAFTMLNSHQDLFGEIFRIICPSCYLELRRQVYKCVPLVLDLRIRWEHEPMIHTVDIKYKTIIPYAIKLLRQPL